MGDSLKINNIITIGFIIIMILLIMCKCNHYSEYFNNNSNIKIKEEDSGLYYGSSPTVIGSSLGLNYIRVNAENEIEIPNSKTALRRLMDEGSYKCRTLETNHDNIPSEHLLKRQSIDNVEKRNNIQNQFNLRNNIVQSQ
jgi:hypothetical protein